MQTIEEYVFQNKYIIAAHRGASGSAPENTLPAFKEALASGVKMIEIDVQFTKDDTAVVFHDNVLGRTSNCSGKVQSYTIDEIKSLDAGAWFSDNYKGEKILTLAETLEFLKGKAHVNIEIKPGICFEKQEDAIRNIIKIVKSLEFEKNTLFGSFDYNALKLIKRLDPNLYTAAVKLPKDKTMPSQIKEALKCDAFVCSLKELSHKLCADAVNSGLFVGVYGVDTLEQLNKALKYDIKAIASNNPHLIINKMREDKLIK